MNLIDFTKNGGYRFKQFTLRKMQEAYIQIMKVFIAFCNVPEVGNYIISGCIIVGENITSGYLYIDGELCAFSQSPGTLETKIKKNVVIQSLGFKNGNNENVFRFTNAVTHLTDGAALSTFTRVSPVFDSNYVHTDNNFTNALEIKLAGIENGAEVNVQSDYDVTDITSSAFIKNMPEFMTILRKGIQHLGEFPVGTDESRLISCPDIGTINYSVIYSIVSLGGFNDDNDVITMVKNKTTSSFNLLGSDYPNVLNDLTIEFYLIKNT